MTGYASDIIPAICVRCGHHFPVDRHVLLACDGDVTCGCEVTGERPNSVDNPPGARAEGESRGSDAADAMAPQEAQP